jgi:predicted metal-binding protein
VFSGGNFLGQEQDEDMSRKTPSTDKYVKRALAASAAHAKRIPAASVVTAAWVRLKCQYGCGGYGQCLTCPPNSPRPDETARMLAEYETAILVHFDGHVEVTPIMVELEREAFLDGFYKAFAMGAGPCGLCDDCNSAGGGCRNPEKARPSMEACGIDVFRTARDNGFPIDVVRNQNCPQNCYGLLLLE